MTQSNNWHDPDLTMIRDVVAHTSDGCEGCLTLGTRWEHLMLCLTCGYVGCSDGSPMRHARHHAERSGHPIVQSLHAGDNWRWCFVHDAQICTPYPATGARVVAPSLVPGPSDDLRHGLRIAKSQ
ncbi:UBP-type zinc finger domain-containing protein [Rhodococcus opacus]|uniref:UBP-type zinc finger domain-containing protein n=1 Tax=Rhodococcus opacus TaxID=37919 RepID=UPI001FF56D63|nr:UBP-type zinc finger domain-containing protein [Rhodococcus opacus]UOT02199.1 UBP-type zinc finger domain-containing protein [Rhodococcus opacus]